MECNIDSIIINLLFCFCILEIVLDELSLTTQLNDVFIESKKVKSICKYVFPQEFVPNRFDFTEIMRKA